MKLHRVRLANWRSFRNGSCEVEFDDRGTIISGPNERGKSTIFEAVRRALFDRARTSAGWVDRLVPYGVNGALPEVTLDFEHAGRVLRVCKRFGARGSSELSEQQNGQWLAIAANEEAEEQLLAVLGAQLGTRRTGSSPENWGPFQWLFVPQDDRRLPANGTATASLGLDHAGISAEFEHVQSAVERDYGQTFTASGRLAQNGDLQQVENSLASLRETQEALARELDRFDAQRHRFEEIQDALPSAREDATRAKAELDAVDAQVIDLSTAQHRLESAMEHARATRQAAIHAREIIAERDRREHVAAEATGALEKVHTEHLRAQVEVDQVQERFAAARRQASEVGDAVADLRRQFAAASQRLRIVRGKRSLAELQDKLSKAADLDSRIEELSAGIVGEVAQPADLAEAERLLAESRANRDILPRLALHVAVTGQPEVRVLADGTPVVGPETIAIDHVCVEAAGGKVRIQGNTHEAQRLADAAAEQERELSNLLDRFGVSDIGELHRLRENRLRLRGELDALKQRREALDPRSMVEMASDRERLSAEIVGIEEACTPSEEFDSLPEGDLAFRVDRIGADARDKEGDFGRLRADRDSLAANFDVLRQRAEATAAVLQAAATRLEVAQAELDQHRDQFGSTDRCRANHDTAQRDAGRAENETHACCARLEALEKTAITRRQAAKQKTDRLATVVCQLEAEAQQIEDSLAREAVTGAYSRLAATERQIENEERRLSALRQRAAAVQLLKKILDEVRTEVVNQVVGPIKADLDELLATVTCGRYRIAQIDERLAPVRLDGAAQCVFEDGSEGLRELVTTLIRASVAAHLSAEQPQVLILDDPCAHVSRERTARLVEALNQLSDRGIQVVILTHRPYEFADLIGKEVDLQGAIGGLAA